LKLDLQETAQNFEKRVLQKCFRVTFYTYIPVKPFHFLKKHQNHCTLVVNVFKKAFKHVPAYDGKPYDSIRHLGRGREVGRGRDVTLDIINTKDNAREYRIGLLFDCFFKGTGSRDRIQIF
jgi:hypothetical protein